MKKIELESVYCSENLLKIYCSDMTISSIFFRKNEGVRVLKSWKEEYDLN